jgi:hypothetical protein
VANRIRIVVLCTLLGAAVGPGVGSILTMLPTYIGTMLRTGDLNFFPLLGFALLSYVFGGLLVALPAAFAFGLFLALMPTQWLSQFRGSHLVLAILMFGFIAGAAMGLLSASIWYYFSGSPVRELFFFSSAILGGGVGGTLCFHLLGAKPPNPSLNPNAPSARRLA